MDLVRRFRNYITKNRREKIVLLPSQESAGRIDALGQYMETTTRAETIRRSVIITDLIRQYELEGYKPVMKREDGDEIEIDIHCATRRNH